jgi:putative ABC transport system permease protein
MTFLSSWRTALRVARRESRRAKGRSALVVAMIALPMAALAVAAVSYDMFTLTGAEKADRTMGTADARIQFPFHGAVRQLPDPYGPISLMSRPMLTEEQQKPGTEAELRALLPAGSTVVALRRGSVRMRTADGIGAPNAVSLDASSPLARGYVDVLAGRAPTGTNEVALTEQAMTRLGAGLGGTVRAADTGTPYTVVGQVEFPSLLDEVVLFPPISGEPPKGFTFNENAWLVDTPGAIGWPDVLRYNRSGLVVASRAVYLDPPPDAEVLESYGVPTTNEYAIAVIIAGLALLEIVLLAGPAFAVSARRRQRQLALVAANGGTPAHIRRIVLADGVLLGAVGAVVGIGAGIVAAFAGRPLVEELLANSRAGGYRVFPAALAAIAGLAVVTGVLAALTPAFITARQNVVASLAGRRGVARSRKRWIAVGVVMIAIGGAVTVYGSAEATATVTLAGLVIGELGLVLCTPALVGLIARIGRVLPLTPRIALRDAARNRASAAPAISAVMAAVAGSVALGLYLDSSHTLQARTYQPSLPTGGISVSVHPDSVGTPSAVEAALRATTPVAEVHPVSGVVCASTDATERYSCMMRPVFVPELECPAYRILQTGQRQLTAAERKAAREDPRCATERLFSNGVAVDDGTALAALTGAAGDDLARARAVLRDGGAVTSNPAFLGADGMVTLSYVAQPPAGTDPGPGAATGAVTPRVASPLDDADDPTIKVPGYLLRTGIATAPTLVPPSLVAKVGLASTVDRMVATTSRMPSQAEEDRLALALEPLASYSNVERGAPTETDPRLWLLIAAAVTITIGAAAVGTGLAAADGRADLSTLAAVGASPTVRRGLSVSQSGVIAGLGSGLGVIAGLGAAIAVISALNLRFADQWPGGDPLPLVVPWVSLLIALVITPVVAVGGAGLLTRSRLPIERRL